MFKIYYKHQQFLRQAHRQIKNYDQGVLSGGASSNSVINPSSSSSTQTQTQTNQYSSLPVGRGNMVNSDLIDTTRRPINGGGTQLNHMVSSSEAVFDNAATESDTFPGNVQFTASSGNGIQLTNNADAIEELPASSSATGNRYVSVPWPHDDHDADVIAHDDLMEQIGTHRE